MKTIWKLARLAVAVGAVATTTGVAGAQASVALEATVVDIAPSSTVYSYPTTDYGRSRSSGDDVTGTTEWRVVYGTGNCCENYLTISEQGRLLDLGGTYVNYSDDRGLTWKSVRPLEPLVNGEGAIVMAPNGDVLAVEWDPYSADHLLAFKYDAALGKWFYNEMVLHTPFYDRPWIAVVPGPLTIDGQTFPYITFVKGGWPSKELWLYSTDGLWYTEASSKIVDRISEGTRLEWLRTVPGAALDWVQPNTNGGMTPLGGGDAFAAPDWPSSVWSVFDGDELAWHGFRFADDTRPEGLFQVDSAGRVHNLLPSGAMFTYRVSSDGGATWRSLDVPLPDGSAIEEIDFRAHGALGIAAVATRAQDSTTGTDRDLVFKIDVDSKYPRLLRRYEVGLGDVNATGGVGNPVRFDFETLAIFPDGRIAVSMLDSTTRYVTSSGAERYRPAAAIEGATTLDNPDGAEKQVVGDAQSPFEATVTVPSAGAGERIAGVTSVYVEFDSLDGADNARMLVEATPNLAADIDLYLQKQLSDGSWSGDLAEGTSGSLEREKLESGRLGAGRYRIEVHDWLGPPAVEVALKVTFFNSDGEPGT